MRLSCRGNGICAPQETFHSLLSVIFSPSNTSTAQLKILTHRRDLHHDHDYWKSTSFAFANTVHPLHSRAYWPAARRTLLAFDWIGHGRNRAKLSSLTTEQRALTAKCVLCGMKDSQQHCMLECPHPPFTAIRNIAKKEQAETATLLRAKYPSRGAMHFTDQICHGSWTPSDNTSRLWLGLWNRSLLEEVLRQDLAAPLSMTSRKIYLKIARALTKPLINAYTGLLLIINATQAQREKKSKSSASAQVRWMFLTATAVSWWRRCFQGHTHPAISLKISSSSSCLVSSGTSIDSHY